MLISFHIWTRESTCPPLPGKDAQDPEGRHSCPERVNDLCMARVGKEEGAGLLPALSSPGCEMAAPQVCPLEQVLVALEQLWTAGGTAWG